MNIIENMLKPDKAHTMRQRTSSKKTVNFHLNVNNVYAKILIIMCDNKELDGEILFYIIT